jgi:hypothetical protein
MAVDARLRGVTDAMDDPAATEAAFRGLAAWRIAFAAYTRARWGK